ncbi:MAG: rod shape-determining protein RodA [Clostridia bacterium]|nr:rod shape-determining protein RodA [Clostridia bacterium]
MIAENRRARAHLDIPLIAIVYALSLFGILAVAVATYSTSSDPDQPLLNHIMSSTSARRQALYVAISPIVLAIMVPLPIRFYRQRAALLYWLATGLITVVWVFNRATGVKQWLDLFMSFTIQPTEFAKLAIILMLARIMSSKEKPMSNRKDIFRTLAVLGLPSVVIMLSGETGSFFVIAFLFVFMLWFAKVDFRVLFVMLALVVLLVLAIYAYAVASGSDDYRLLRILSFFDRDAYSESAYQQTHSMTAIGSGGLSGRGTFVDDSWYQLNYVPADWTDFIYATIGEAWGFVGCVGVLAAYLLMILRMLWLARYTRDRFGMLVIIGVTGMFTFHVIENIGMTTGLLPITGIPLPFLSYGGSNMITNIAGIGLVLNVTKNRSLSGSYQTPQSDTSALRYTTIYRT